MHTSRFVRCAAAAGIVVGAAASSPAVALAEAGCDSGEQSGATHWVTGSGYWTNTGDAWRFYAALTPEGTSDHYSTLLAFNYDATAIYQAQFDEFAGKWTNAHFDELSEREQIWNHTNENRYFFYKRSCTK